ncbi:hypothetical protein [Methylophaga sp.]|jgi:hypothetical protein|uniref:hypothetical protein n=1 Tax=Methylophaga sp. TaxID=2024840 RepID=UPI003F71F64F
MERFTNSILQSIQSENWFAALFLALALPDICGALENPSKKVGERYKDWFNKYLRHEYDTDPNAILQSMIAQVPNVDIKSATTISKLIAKSQNALPFTAEDCYRLRCKCLHEGLTQTQTFEHIHFTVPHKQANVKIHKNIKNGNILQLSIDIFCSDVCEAVRKWEIDVINNQEIQGRIQNLIKIYQTDDREFPITN